MAGGALSYTADWNGSGHLDLPAEWLTVLALCCLIILAVSIVADGLAKTAALAMRQLAAMAMMLYVARWWSALVISSATQDSIGSWVAPSRAVAGTGLALFVEGTLYLQLPWDVIPDSIPLIGKLDDAVAKLMAVFGLGMIGIALYFDLELLWGVLRALMMNPAAEPAPSRGDDAPAGAAEPEPEPWWPPPPPLAPELPSVGVCVAVVIVGGTAAAGALGVPLGQAASNVVGLLTGRLIIMNIGGERAIVAAVGGAAF